MSWIHAKAREALVRIREAKEEQDYPFFREFGSGGGLHTDIAGKPIVNFSSNDYLGPDHPPQGEGGRQARGRQVRVRPLFVAAAGDDDRARRASRSASRSGWGSRSASTFTTGYQAMLGTIAALADKDTTLVLDAYSHACILDGSFLAAGVPKNGPEIRFFNHNSAKSLERILKTRERKNALVLCEGVYSLDGDTAPLREFVELCDRYEAPLVLDDAHAHGHARRRAAAARSRPWASRAECPSSSRRSRSPSAESAACSSVPRTSSST